MSARADKWDLGFMATLLPQNVILKAVNRGEHVARVQFMYLIICGLAKVQQYIIINCAPMFVLENLFMRKSRRNFTLHILSLVIQNDGW